MNLKDTETRIPGPGNSLGKFSDRALNHLTSHGSRRRPAWSKKLTRGADRDPAAIGDRNGLCAFPGACNRCFSSGMAKLNGRDSALRADEIHHALHRVALLVVPEPEAVWSNPAARLGVRGLRENDAGA